MFLETVIRSNASVFMPDFDETKLERVDMDQMQLLCSSIKQLVRDWSAEGQRERDLSYKPIVDELERLFPLEEFDRSKVSVLVPGCGLGRLPFEIAVKGFACQGNELSYYMLLTSQFMLNHTAEVDQFEIHPFIHTFSNHKSREDHVRGITIPDIVPEKSLNNNPNFTMSAGDFVDVYGSKDCANECDVLATCFFIDTAKNVIDYLEAIANCLKEGGYWINLGPLLYHFETSNVPSNSPEEPGPKAVPTLELTLDQLFCVMKKMGFEILQHRELSTGYMGDERSMIEWIYHPHFWVAQLVRKS
ncbi:methyltransferase N2227 family protein [Schizosaccharomyces japonicus yFS275]|uniref:carnosine N-methyltransferase n=1 Tax=Schizosaccharomyces japonicus (strain yFS275 / FY16936) TaxID=402676 RepID=B6K3A3_SCHJY|nr:methyltransferase N2227 family protein [Schizosaccharomyces japonicus yFS275]EEB07960.2 methyltransferase N2227 family protein [Schizosaccharomyces japonicus yFS275]